MENCISAAKIEINVSCFLWRLIVFTFYETKNVEPFLRNSCESDLWK